MFSAWTTRSPGGSVLRDGHPVAAWLTDVLAEVVRPSGRWAPEWALDVSRNPKHGYIIVTAARAATAISPPVCLPPTLSGLHLEASSSTPRLTGLHYLPLIIGGFLRSRFAVLITLSMPSMVLERFLATKYVGNYDHVARKYIPTAIIVFVELFSIFSALAAIFSDFGSLAILIFSFFVNSSALLVSSK
ncbi:unnamed protein product [Caenorhabditis auriculariae]|uniref:Uncharacterized protein n=1 Tax=Caenorhabditis auriculariae TaxID=2777116 RepID=A0A8S1HZZ6_9PELO|nr:unnamed protein product [Caenorhabditis auriculariae]